MLLSGRKRWRLLPNTEGNCSAFRGWREPCGIWDASGDRLLVDCAGSWNSLADLFGLDLGKAPALEGGVELVQEAGELLVFPGFWWHQTCAESEAWAVCAQRLNCRNVDRVLGHVAAWCGLGALSSDVLASPEARVEAVLSAALEAKGGAAFPGVPGEEVLSRLRGLDRALPQVPGGSSSHILRLSNEDLVSALWGSIALRFRNESFLEALCQQAPLRAAALSPGQLAAAAWALALAQGGEAAARGPGARSAGARLAAETARRLHELAPGPLASAAWALARLPLGPALAPAAAEVLARRFGELAPRHMGHAAWALAHLSDSRPLTARAAAAAAAALRQPGPPGGGGCGSLGVAWALAELSAGWSPDLVAALGAHAERRREAPTCELAQVLWAAATAVARDEDEGGAAAAEHPLVSALAAQALERAAELSPTHLARSSWAFALLGTGPGHAPLYRAFAREAPARIRQFDPGGLAAQTWAFATLGLRDDNFLAEVAARALQSTTEWAAGELAAAAWSLEALQAAGGAAPLLAAAAAGAGRGRGFAGLLLLEPEGC